MKRVVTLYFAQILFRSVLLYSIGGNSVTKYVTKLNILRILLGRLSLCLAYILQNVYFFDRWQLF